jgi:hypothetical protein
MNTENARLSDANSRLRQQLLLSEAAHVPCSTAVGGSSSSSGGSSGSATAGATRCVHAVEEEALVAELIHTKYLLAVALSDVDEEKLHCFRIIRAVDKLLL